MFDVIFVTSVLVLVFVYVCLYCCVYVLLRVCHILGLVCLLAVKNGSVLNRRMESTRRKT